MLTIRKRVTQSLGVCGGQSDTGTHFILYVNFCYQEKYNINLNLKFIGPCIILIVE